MSDVTDDHEILVRNAVQFYEAGGSITYGEWLDVPIEHRLALVEARDILESQTIEAIEARADARDYTQHIHGEQAACETLAKELVGS